MSLGVATITSTAESYAPRRPQRREVIIIIEMRINHLEKAKKNK